MYAYTHSLILLPGVQSLLHIKNAERDWTRTISEQIYRYILKGIWAEVKKEMDLHFFY